MSSQLPAVSFLSSMGNSQQQQDYSQSMANARSAFYKQLPIKLQRAVAFRHFYTEELDRASSILSLKFVSAFVLYFCALFRMEGRRKQYLTTQTDKSGRDFALAHHRAREIFLLLSRCYSVIVTRYNIRSFITISQRKAGNTGFGEDTLKNGARWGSASGSSTVARERAFVYIVDEERFYEELYNYTQKMLFHAFRGDAGLQAMVAKEVERLYRSKAFMFGERTREKQINAMVDDIEHGLPGILRNSRQLASLLLPPAPRVVMKYAVQQRTPFVASTFPGGTSWMKYQRLRKTGYDAAPSRLEQEYNVEDSAPSFRRHASCHGDGPKSLSATLQPNVLVSFSRHVPVQAVAQA